MKCQRCRTWNAVFSLSKGNKYVHICSSLRCSTPEERAKIDAERDKHKMGRIQTLIEINLM